MTTSTKTNTRTILSDIRAQHPTFSVRDATEDLEFEVTQDACDMGDASSCMYCTWSLAVRGAMRRADSGGKVEVYTTPSYVYVADFLRETITRYVTSERLREEIVNVLDVWGVPKPGIYKMRAPAPSQTLEGKRRTNGTQKSRVRVSRHLQKPRNTSRFHLS